MRLPKPLERFYHAFPKIIFLDFDNTLSSERQWLARFSTSHDIFDPINVQIINNICAVSGAKVVLNTTNAHIRSKPSYDLCRGMLDRNGFDLSHLHPDWTTQYSEEMKRAQDVEEWLARHPEVTHYVTVDDEDIAYPHLVRASETDGILYAHVEQMCRFLDTDIRRVFRQAMPESFDQLSFKL